MNRRGAGRVIGAAAAKVAINRCGPGRVIGAAAAKVAMSRRALAVVLALSCADARAGAWTNLWLTPEQQGERALAAGNANEAARLFTDPRRRAYAELEAKQYDAAQKRLAPLGDAQSQYNRGNALARSGNLQGALDAYDASLQHTDADGSLRRDARHNRDLVAKQLERQKQQQSGAGKDQNSRGQQGQSQDSAQNRSGSQDSKAANQPQQSRQQPGEQPQAGQQASRSQDGGDPKHDRPSASGSQNGEQPSEAKDAAAQRDAARGDAAQRDAARGDAAQAVQQKSAQNRGSRPTSGDVGKGEQPLGEPTPPTEQTLALDQWLRQIPDDPGGLLRRKFLIEHMIKQDAGGTP